LNSNTTDRHHPSRRRRPTGRGGPSRRGSHAPSHPAASASRAPALEPFPCDSTPVPYSSLNLDARLVEGLRDLSYTQTRPIQTAVIPLALAGRDLIACAETGTGKTAAFVVPTLQWLLEKKGDGSHFRDRHQPASSGQKADQKGDRSPLAGHLDGAAKKDSRPLSKVLVLAPTRELAVQIEDEIHGLAYHTPITSAAVYGGVDMGVQERALRAGVDIIVATPGRLIDHLRQQNADLTGVELLVLDEADRMMDMGFWPDVRRIIAAIPNARQTLLFSATMPDDVVRFALEIVREPAYIQVGQRSAPPKSITHRVEVMQSSAKLEWLTAYLRRPDGPTLVFMRTKIGAERLARRLSAAGIKAAALHANRTQEQRRAAVEGFRGGRFTALIATDIAARGLDIDGIRTVINYEVPDSPDAYVHRVGRTGRADEVGQAITLVAPEEQRALAQLEKSVGVRLELKQSDV
jgi:ATP-dependent RNA helicase RhlE